MTCAAVSGTASVVSTYADVLFGEEENKSHPVKPNKQAPNPNITIFLLIITSSSYKLDQTVISHDPKRARKKSYYILSQHIVKYN